MIYFLLLLCVTAVWGWTFVIVKDAISQYPTLPFLGLRFLVSLLLMIAVVHRLPGRRTLRVGAVIGLALSAGYLAQTVGLKYTSPGNAGLLTGLFVVFTPVLERAFGSPVPLRTALAVVAALVGTVALTAGDMRSFAPLGDGLELLCAVAFALHIVLLSRWAPGLPPAELAMVQIACAALLFSAGGLPSLRPPSGLVWTAVVITGVLAGAFGFFVQTWAQSKLTASRAALILATEPAWALFFGVVLAHQVLGPVQAAGAALVLVAILGHEALAARARRGLAGSAGTA